jgi:archaeosortase B (VPXXXP-CTERM-specific)
VQFVQRNRALLLNWVLFLIILGALVAFSEWASDLVNVRFAFQTARWTAALLRAMGITATVVNGFLTCGLCRYEVIGECTAYFPCAVYASAVLAYPAPWLRRLLGVLVGIPLLLGINQVRLISLCFVQRSYPDLFDFIHYVVWQALIIFFAVLLWVIWASSLGRAR